MRGARRHALLRSGIMLECVQLSLEILERRAAGQPDPRVLDSGEVKKPSETDRQRHA